MTKKLDKEHLDAIQDLRTQFGQNSAALGSITIEEMLLKKQLESLAEVKEQEIKTFQSLQQTEQQLMSTLKERYGEGEINIQDGTFTPVVTAE